MFHHKVLIIRKEDRVVLVVFINLELGKHNKLILERVVQEEVPITLMKKKTPAIKK